MELVIGKEYPDGYVAVTLEHGDMVIDLGILNKEERERLADELVYCVCELDDGAISRNIELDI